MNSKIVEDATLFAEEFHKDQTRKYTGEPYVNHCKNVGELVAQAGADEETIAAAILHDVIEDTPATFKDVFKVFGPKVATLVRAVTKITTRAHGNRAERAAIERVHLSLAPPEAKLIKIADIVDNCTDLKRLDSTFAKVYFKEKQELLKVLDWHLHPLKLKAVRITGGCRAHYW